MTAKKSLFTWAILALACSLLFPLQTVGQSDTGAREIKSSVIKRLLPLFEQHVPDTATALRTQLQELSSNSQRDLMGMNMTCARGRSREEFQVRRAASERNARHCELNPYKGPERFTGLTG